MSESSSRTLEGVQIDVEQLFAVQVDFSHLRVTISAILDALNKSTARTAALEKQLASVSDKADALGDTVTSLQGAVQEGASKLEQAQAQLQDHAAWVHTLQNNEREAAERIAALERDLAALRAEKAATPPPQPQQAQQQAPQPQQQQGPDYSGRIAALEAALAALEASDKELRSLLASGNDKMSDLERAAAEADAAARAAQAQAAAAADAAARNSMGGASDFAIPAAVAAPVAVVEPPQQQQAAPLPSANNDALLQRLKQVASALDTLTGRVSALESQQASLARQQQVLQQNSAAALAPAPTPVPLQRVPSKTKRGSDSGSANGNAAAATGASELDRDTLNRLSQSEAHTARQLAATLVEMAQIQAQLASLERGLASKASSSELDLKADQSDLAELVSRGGAQAAQLALVERDLDALRSQMSNLASQHSSLQSKVASLAEAASCARCQERRPTLRCAKCAMSLCDACDEELHGAAAEPAMQAHLRTPLDSGASAGPPAAAVGFVAAPATAAAPSFAPSSSPPASAAPSFRAPVSAVSSDDELRRWAEEQFALLNRKEKATRVDIHELYSKDKDLRAKLDALVKASADDKTAYADLVGAMKKLEAELRALVGNAAAGARHYTDNRIEELLLKLRELERALEKGMKSELKRFERDVLVFMESAQHGEGGGHGGGDAAVGKIHFRCLSCDQTVGNLQGPSSLLYARAVGQAGSGGGGASANSNGGATTLSIERGRELYLNGRDGAVYKGRDPSMVTIAPGDPGRPAQFQVNYGNHSMPTTNARGTTIVDQKTVNAPYSTLAPGQPPPSTPQRGGALLRPSSAHEQHQHSAPRGTTLPPTRPATRTGLRSRASDRSSPSQLQAPLQQLDEQRTPERQQLPSTSF